MKNDYFYSKTLDLYISRKPLKIDARVKNAAKNAGITLEWDDLGRINYLNFRDAKKLLRELGAQMLSPSEYWAVYNEVKKVGDDDMFQELSSKEYCEWLDRVYHQDGFYIDHPTFEHEKALGKKQKTTVPYGRPGWFNPEDNIAKNSGVPLEVEIFREKYATSWKYWSPDFTVTSVPYLAPIRGYVTSVGKPSFDLGIPISSKQPVQLVRECRRNPLESQVPEEVMEKAMSIMESYCELAKNPLDQQFYMSFFRDERKILSFLSDHGAKFFDIKANDIYKIRELIFNVLGYIKIRALFEQDENSLSAVNKTITACTGKKEDVLTYGDFKKFILSTQQSLQGAYKENADIVFVMGHKNPDADTVVSTLFEAWRNHLYDKSDIVYIPVVQSHKIPDEVRVLLGDEVSDHIPLTNLQLYREIKNSGLARWISVDQNLESEVQKYFIAIIDHHVTSETAQKQEIPKTLELVGSCIGLIYQKILGFNIKFDNELSRIVYGTALLDTENKVAHKMTPKDKMVMEVMKKESKINDDDLFYSHLMSHLLNTDDPDVLFKRDYKEDWGFGFAVSKIKGGFDVNGTLLKKSLMDKAFNLAKDNTRDKNLPLTILRVTNYAEDNISVTRERIYLSFGELVTDNFKNAIFTHLQNIILFEFGDVNIKQTKNYVEFWGGGHQLSRKHTAPQLEPIVKSFNAYFYSPTPDVWVKRDFLQKTTKTLEAFEQLNIKLSTDNENNINYLTYPEAKAVADKLGFKILTLQEYWEVLDDANRINDRQMINSLQGSNFVEFLDTVIKNYKDVFSRPFIQKSGEKFLVKGESTEVKIPNGNPGLIHPDDIDRTSGIPNKVRNPDEYGNKELWRYWEPDHELVIITRSYIFLLQQPCWDGKFHINDSFPNLGVRPVYTNLPEPKVRSRISRDSLELLIENDGDIDKYVKSKL